MSMPTLLPKSMTTWTTMLTSQILTTQTLTIQTWTTQTPAILTTQVLTMQTLTSQTLQTSTSKVDAKYYWCQILKPNINVDVKCWSQTSMSTPTLMTTSMTVSMSQTAPILTVQTWNIQILAVQTFIIQTLTTQTRGGFRVVAWGAHVPPPIFQKNTMHFMFSLRSPKVTLPLPHAPF